MNAPRFEWSNYTLEYWFPKLIMFGTKVLVAILLFIIGRWLIQWIVKSVKAVMTHRQVAPAVISFTSSLTSISLYVLLAITILSSLGIEVVSFAALLASAGVAIGMALSNDLKNLAGGIVLLVTRPIHVGDWVETSAGSGTVEAINIFHTVLRTASRQKVYIPNGVMTSNAIVNYSLDPNRRLEWIIGVEYNTDVNMAKQEIMALLKEDSRIQTDPQPVVHLKALNDSSVDILVRAWCQNDEYWDVYFDFNQKVYDHFNKKGIGFPFPTLTVYNKQD